MSEYSSVEKPFLDKLLQIGWSVINHNEIDGDFKKNNGIPQNPSISLRPNFNEWFLRDTLKSSFKDLNPWINDEQINYCIEKITVHDDPSEKLFEINKSNYELLRKGIPLPENLIKEAENSTVTIIHKDYTKNSFIAINQFRINTPGATKKFIIPDIVCFVNGLPLIVIECKDKDKAEPMSEAFDQIQSYENNNQEYSTYGNFKEGCEELFYTNLFNVLTHGTEAKFGTLYSDFEFFNNWRDIFPEEYRTVETEDGGVYQEVMIRGMFNHEILIDLFKNFCLFMELKNGDQVKVIARYNQYRAVGKMVQKLKTGKTWQERSGVIWHTQGSGKTLTMVFLVKKMRAEFELKDYKILMIVDRLDLEEQLYENAVLTGEKVSDISTLEKSGNKTKNDEYLVALEGDNANLNLLMIHKFRGDKEDSTDFLIKNGYIPKVEIFPEINPSERILILIDEAHRTQGGDMNTNLFLAFPNATRIGFTGTPLITEKNKITTSERFCQNKDAFIDTYKMNDAVKDHATVDIKYKAIEAFAVIKEKEQFDEDFEKIFKAYSEAARQEIQKRYGGMKQYLASKERIELIADDIMKHYVSEILPNGFKAMIVTSSIEAAVRYKYVIESLIPKYIKEEENKDEEERDELLLKRLKILKARAVVSQEEQNELPEIRMARIEGQPKSVRENFCKDFDVNDPQKADTGIGFLCVCDRLLTGFDAPIAQVLYMDKPLAEQNLMQAIARVNRTKRNKTHGLVVDYFGITKALIRALGIYTDAEEKENIKQLEEFGEYFKAISKEVPELELRWNKIEQIFENLNIDNSKGFFAQTLTPEQEHEFVEDVLYQMDIVANRTKLLISTQDYFDRLDLLFGDVDIQRNHWIKAKRLGYLIYLIRDHYKDETMDLKHTSRKVRQLIDKYVVKIGLKTKVEEVSILDDDFPKIKDKYRGKKAQASAMEHNLRYQIKVDLENKDPAMYVRFKDKIDSIIANYDGNWDLMIKEFEKLKEELSNKEQKDERFTSMQLRFYEAIKMNLATFDDDKLGVAALRICHLIKDNVVITNFWEKNDEQTNLRDGIAQICRFSGIPELKEKNQQIASSMMELAKYNYKEIIKNPDEMA